MRTIKYRIWDSKIKQYATEDYQFLISRTGDLWGAVGDWLGVHFSEDDGFEIEQYTGVDDFDGNPIYEGDILQYSNMTVAVDFRHGVFGVQLTDDQRASLPFIIEQCETQAVVIGNIHENPKLLEAD